MKKHSFSWIDTDLRIKNKEAIIILQLIVFNGVPKGIRTPVTAVKGRCPRPLDDGDPVMIGTASLY